MNKRIKELSEQATDEYHYSTWNSTDQKEVKHYKFNKEKFAELIVRECMEVARPFYMGTPEDSVYYVEQAVNRIAKHFGVE